MLVYEDVLKKFSDMLEGGLDLGVGGGENVALETSNVLGVSCNALNGSSDFSNDGISDIMDSASDALNNGINDAVNCSRDFVDDRINNTANCSSDFILDISNLSNCAVDGSDT